MSLLKQRYNLINRDRSVAVGLVVIALSMGMLTSFSVEAGASNRTNKICFQVSEDDVINLALRPTSTSSEISSSQSGAWAGQPFRTWTDLVLFEQSRLAKSCPPASLGVMRCDALYLLCVIRL